MGTFSAVTSIIITLLCSATHTIRVPIDWASDSDSDVTNEKQTDISSAESIAPIPIPVEYFQYPANKPKFAVDVASYHGVKNPKQHYSSYPIRPYTGKDKPVLGKHKILNAHNPVFQQLNEFTQINEGDGYVAPSSSDYEVFHPYKSEEPALQEIYKDPVLDKIRNDIYNSQNRLQNYEKEAGQPNVEKDEYLERPEQTDRKKLPHRNVPVPYEIHRPQRRPIYYRPAPNFNRDHFLNHKFRHPWNQQNAKIRPVHYQPLKNHIHRLRQHHALKYDDKQNEYPQVSPPESYAEVPDGYDIYERGKEKYVALRNNVDESINDAVKENRPTIYNNIELQNNGDKTVSQIRDAEEDEFIPIKNYAQVRKTESLKHFPREAAYADAASYDEIHNAPRLREAIKSTKSQTVYTEEGYEDAAFDHAGEEKHAAENEGHGGHLNEKEISGGKYKAPSLSEKYQEASGNEYRDQNLHGEKWKNDDKDNINDTEEKEYIDDENEQSIETDVYEQVTGDRNKRNNEENNKESSNENEEDENNSEEVEVSERSKRENKPVNDTDTKHHITNESGVDYEDHKLNTNTFKIPLLNFSTTFFTADEILQKAKIRTSPKKHNLHEKYPYYFKNLKNIHRNSPLRYAENLKFIPKKSKYGTEFYDSRSSFKCPEVEAEVDALPEKLKKDGHPDEGESNESKDTEEENKTKGKADFTHIKKNSRLRGLGDKIDCFKTKYFGENPLDSPFFKEDIISNPEPITAPNLPAYKLFVQKPLMLPTSTSNVSSIADVSNLFHKLKGEQESLQESFIKKNANLDNAFTIPQNLSIIKNPSLSPYTGVLDSIGYNRHVTLPSISVISEQHLPIDSNQSLDANMTYMAFQNKENVANSSKIRKKRSMTFVYEPYKIIRDSQVLESKKTTTTSNVSPLIKKLQSSRVIDRATKPVQEDNRPVKRNVATRTYKDIGKKEREKIIKGSADSIESSIIDVNIDQRRREPRYEIRVNNHKSEYTPVNNKKAMSLEDYEAQTNKTINTQEVEKAEGIVETTTVRLHTITNQKPIYRKPTTTRPFFDISQFIPTSKDVHKTSASNTVRQVVKKPVSIVENNDKKEEIPEARNHDDDDEGEYDEYDDEEATTTTTVKPAFRRRRLKTTTTTSKPEEELAYPKLRLITRFNSSPASISAEEKEPTEKPVIKKDKETDIASPKYREKKKKSSKSTLVTDTKTYGEDNDNDMLKDEVDAMIGVQQDMEEYMPRYEKEIKGKHEKNKPLDTSEREDEEDEDDDTESEEDDIDEELHEDDISESEEEESNESNEELKVTTPEPSKRTLVRTTEAPISTTETRKTKITLKPIVHRKKIEIHKEIPINKSSPHTTQFKQDIEEVEITKESPPNYKAALRLRQKNPQKNKEALELYKDENLATEINKLGAVEVFKENLDLKKGPRHGGNYRVAQSDHVQEFSKTSQSIRGRNTKAKDTDTSQSENAELEITEILPARRLRGRNQPSAQLKTRGRNAKLELDESIESSAKKLHGGNLMSIKKKDQRRENIQSAKLIELDDEPNEDEGSSHEIDEDNSNTYDNSRANGRSLHGGNYKSAKLVEDDIEVTTEKEKNKPSVNSRNKAAVLLNSFAQAVPILTSTPAYILDPSKRMYFYVDD